MENRTTISHVRAEPTRSSRCRGILPRSQPSRFRSRRCRHVERGVRERSDRGNNQVEEEGRGLEATLELLDGSQNNPAYKLDCWWDMEAEHGENRKARRGEEGGGGVTRCDSGAGNTYRCANICAHSYTNTRIHCTRDGYTRHTNATHARICSEHPVISAANSTLRHNATLELHEYARIYR